MASLAGLMKDLPKIKARLAEVKDRLGEVKVSAETGGGAVKATANGLMRVVSLEINPALMATLVDASNEDDRAMAQDLVVGAVNAALARARERAEQEMSEAASELGLPIPPGGLGGMMT
ncbi:MAG TPA: YbaB/EbfC family nucleoid-associated protein [Phycisphaerales bacterium]|nr:YbaB/EbfC family nucleoid-associated protein [Phycisphaerales bacterium]